MIDIFGKKTRSRRALLYMPGDDIHKIQKAITLGVDCLCMDMEDGVALNRKSIARKTIVNALETLDFGNAEKLVRINQVGSGLENDDLAAAIPARPDGIVIPKVSHPQEIRWVSDQITAIEEAHNWPLYGIGLLVIVETSLGIVNLKDLANADPRLWALIFGAEDLAGDLGAKRTPQGEEIFYARSLLVLHASAFGLQAIDMVHIDFEDLEGLVKESQKGYQMGFSGKQIIHPKQVIPVQNAFTPSDEEIAQAMRIQDSFDAHQKSGVGAFAVNGKMIDAPMVKLAEQVLAKARAAGKI
jgi:citrate lyase beta subunit